MCTLINLNSSVPQLTRSDENIIVVDNNGRKYGHVNFVPIRVHYFFPSAKFYFTFGNKFPVKEWWISPKNDICHDKTTSFSATLKFRDPFQLIAISKLQRHREPHRGAFREPAKLITRAIIDAIKDRAVLVFYSANHTAEITNGFQNEEAARNGEINIPRNNL